MHLDWSRVYRLKVSKKMNNLVQGFTIEKHFIPPEILKTLIDEITASTRQKSQHGIRNVEDKFLSIAQLANSAKILAKAKAILGGKPQLVRAIFFDKNPEKNWLVPWHQDKTVSVNKKQLIDGWGPWSIKDSTHHVQPSEKVLNNMVTFRIHLDDTNADNGCLKVIPKSHEHGVLKQSKIHSIVKDTAYIECEAKAGDMLIIRPLILHASSKAKSPKHRRVIHLEFCSYELPEGMKWK
jgi:ectoine hydroxylase-related dioxygenase (phytanoyl-CoA dioxygenase family)